MRPLIPITFAVASCAFLTTACGAATTAPSTAAASATSAAASAASSAAPSATATKAASASASASATNSPTAATSSSAASSGAAAGVPALVQKYCTKAQKVCFDYPAGYKVVSAATSAGAGVPGEQGHVDDAQGNAVFYFADGIAGIGGGCDEASMKDQTIVDSLPTKITALPVTSAYDNPDVHVVRAIIQPASGGGYLAQEYMSRSKNFANAGTVRACGEAFSDVIALTGNKGGVHAGVYPFADPQSVKHYATAEEAKQALASPAYLVAGAMMQTVTIG